MYIYRYKIALKVLRYFDSKVLTSLKNIYGLWEGYVWKHGENDKDSKSLQERVLVGAT